MLKIKKKIQMHIAQRKELDVHKTKQKRDRNRTTTSLVLDSSMQRGRWEFRLNQQIWLRLSSVFESRRISFLKGGGGSSEPPEPPLDSATDLT